MAHLSHSCLQFPFPFFTSQCNPHKPSHHIPSVRCQFLDDEILSSHDDDDETKTDRNRNGLELVKLANLSVTLTAISTSLLPRQSLAVVASAKSEKKRSTARKAEPLSPEELRAWVEGLPTVRDRVPYSEILRLEEQGKLRNVVKGTDAVLRKVPEVVFVVVEDGSRVLRTVVPTVEEDPVFWGKWDELRIDGCCMNAYTPPVKRSEEGDRLVGFVVGVSKWFFDQFKAEEKEKVEKKVVVVEKEKKVVDKIGELRRVREEIKRKNVREAMEVKMGIEMRKRAERERKRLEEKERREKMRKARLNASIRMTTRVVQRIRASLFSIESGVLVNAMAVVICVVFYQYVVVAYKKQRKDHEERLKIQRLDEEERRKMKALEQERNELMDLDAEKGEGNNGQMKMAKDFMKSGARVQGARTRKLPQYMETGINVKFEDVAGLGKIRMELEEVVKFFTHADMYTRRGITIPGGILLSGPPGVGKTLLAKAVAGEAGVNFFSISASQFVEIYVGVGASRVRALYEEAKAHAPSIVFIDELDAVGRQRGRIKGSGGQERDATLNQLLVCLDGFEGRGEVITIASTNRPDVLDEALTRPGRFDRKIQIPKPSFIGRIEILKVHARKKKMAEDVDYADVAAVTEGMVGAELANIIEVAALNIMRAGRTEITTDDLLQAAQKEELGIIEMKDRSPEMWSRIALNGAALAVATVNFPALGSIEYVTIAPRPVAELGYIRMKVNQVEISAGLQSRQTLLDHIIAQLAPRAAEEIWHVNGQFSTVSSGTTHNARVAAHQFVVAGLSGLPETRHGLPSWWKIDGFNEIDSEAMRILDMCYERAKEIMIQNKKLIDVLVEELVEKRSLMKGEFYDLVRIHGSLEPVPPSILDIRMQRLMQHQDETEPNRSKCAEQCVTKDAQ